MSHTYLDKFRSSLPTSQGNHILKLLIQKKDSGEVKNVNEFKKKLKDLTQKILEERITPTFQMYAAIAGTDISSERYNEMVDRIQDDLETAFAEADNLDQIIAAHHNLIHQVALKAIRYGVNELDSRITLYEFLNRNSQGFNDALFNTFRESLDQKAARSEATASLLFVDPRRNQTMSADEDCQVDLIGERLILGADNDTVLAIKEAEWLSNSNSIRSELDAAFENSNILNIIDNTNQTYWVEPILLSETRSTGAPMEVALKMSASQDINYIEIEPASPYPMVLVGIDYYDINNTRQSISMDSIDLKGPIRVNFKRITTNCLIIRTRQDNFKEIQFRKKQGSSNFHKAALGTNYNPVDLASVNEDLKELLSSDFILSDVYNLGDTLGLQVKYFEYILGFDNIRAGFSTFDERGVFVSKKKDVKEPGIAAVRVDEVRPTQVGGETEITVSSFSYPAVSTTESNKFYHGVIEYWMVLQTFTSDNFLIATDTIPLLPLGAERIYHEQLVFSLATTSGQTKDQGQLMFYTEADGSDVKIYRNSTLLSYGTDWEFIDVSDASGLTVIAAGTGKPMKRGIKILGGVASLDIYTASYTPTTGNTHSVPTDTNILKTVDLVGDNFARMYSDNTVDFSNTRKGYIVDRAECYLVTIMRRNSAQQNFTPALEEYMLVVGSKNDDRFSGD